MGREIKSRQGIHRVAVLIIKRVIACLTEGRLFLLSEDQLKNALFNPPPKKKVEMIH
jgi:hypothetical protein